MYGPEIYGMVFSIKTESCGYGDDGYDAYIRLEARENGALLVGKQTKRDCTGTIRRRFKVAFDWALQLRQRLREMKVPVYPDIVMGCDGEFTELRIGGYEGGAKYRWWSAAPEGWEDLDEFALGVRALFDTLCKLADERAGALPELLWTCPIAGMRYAEGAEAAVKGMESGARLELRRENDNRHDGNAIAVMAGDVRIGYVPRACNADMAAWLDRGRQCEARAIVREDEYGAPYLTLAIFSG